MLPSSDVPHDISEDCYWHMGQ